MKQFLKELVKRFTWKCLRVAGLPRYIKEQHQTMMMQGAYQLRQEYGYPYPAGHPRFINNFETKVFSQNGEDGILQYIFSQIGTETKRFIEFGVEDGRECVAANLAIHFGWEGLLMDGSAENVRNGKIFYQSMMPERPDAVRFVQAWITKDNINDLLAEHGWPEIDMLSIDVDGNDYWIWQAITNVRARVAVIEINGTFGPDKAITVAYDPAFDRKKKHPSAFYHGASVKALAILGKKKGYSLVGCDTTGCNAIFIRDDLMKEPFRELTAEEAFLPNRVRLLMGLSTEEQFEIISDLPYAEIEE